MDELSKLLKTTTQKRTIPREATQTESIVWQDFKKALSKNVKIRSYTRLETWAMPGVPDVVFCDLDGNFHFVELKSVSGSIVKLSPHQVAWLTKHSHASVWVIAKKKATKTKKAEIFLYHSSQAVDVSFDGLSVAPKHRSTSEDYDSILSFILKS